MNLSAAKAFNGFILEAKNAFDRVFNREVTEEELEQIKARFINAEFQRFMYDFTDELLVNYKAYRVESIISEYVNLTISDVRYIAFSDDIIALIIKNEWECNFLFSLKKEIENQVDFIAKFFKINPDFERIELMKYCKLLESIERHNNEGVDIITFGVGIPIKEHRFNFEFLLQECADLNNNVDRIRLLIGRLYEFEQWKVQYQNFFNCSVSDIAKHCDKDYLIFEKLCQLEIEKLQKLDAIEKSAQAIDIPENQTVSTESTNTPDYVWKSSATDLLELVTALYQNKSIERRDGKPLTRKELIEYFQQVFDIKISDIEGKLSKATNRKVNQTPFIDSMKVAFITYAKEKEDKLDNRR